MGKGKKFRWWAGFGLALLLVSCGGPKTPELTVSAAISLKDALEAFQPIFEKEHGVKVIYNFNASGTLMQQILQGAPVDVFISAGSKPMDDLEAKGKVLQGTRRPVVTNTLVLVVPQTVPDERALTFARMVSAEPFQLAIGEPGTVPAGTYAKEVLEHLGIYDRLREEKRLVLAGNVRQVLAYVENGEVDGGLVYRTDAALSKKVRVTGEAPSDWHQPIVYPGAVVQGSPQPEVAQRFLQELTEGDGKAILERYGFTVVGP
ncbi:MAG: molybdate ABC transporter substrate-binding protein [Bacillota bacterium]|nr:molybdate ABC transporter substrate-binding protein [Bacillota bacterium]